MRRILSLIMLLVLGGAAVADIDDLRNEAAAAAAAGDIELAMDRYRQILAAEPDDGAANYQMGTLLMDNDGDLDEAVSHFRAAAELGFQPQGVAYRLSRIFARTGRSAEALAQLDALAESGFGSPGLIEGEVDYASIRSEPRFISALDAIRKARYPCQADKRHHGFDFWLGEWTVTQNGQFAGTNNIQALLGHCLVYEQWEGAGGSKGKSFNYYDPGADHWRQIWVSDGGTIIEFTGEARDGGLFYTAETVNPGDGSVIYHRFEFTQNGDGTVRQFWATSSDDRESWTTIWDGRYERKNGMQSGTASPSAAGGD